MKALVKRKPGPENVVMDVPIPEIKEDEILIRVKAASVCGSDMHKFAWDPSMYMYEKYLPLIFGHEFSGVVEKIGAAIDPSVAKPGDRVTINNVHTCGTCEYCRKGLLMMCPEFYWNGGTKDGAYAEFTVVKADQIIKMPDEMSFEAGALIEPIGVAANAVEQLGIGFGAKVGVIGAGAIGLLTVLMAKAAGASEVTIFGLRSDIQRLELAVKELGADRYVINDEQDALAEVKAFTGGIGLDVVFECSGVPKMVNLALSLIRMAGKVGVVGIYSSNLDLDLSTMVRTQKSLVGTFGGLTPYTRTFEWARGHLDLMEKATKIISHRSKLDDFPAMLERSLKHESIKELFVFD